ncbi:MAG: DUF2892 domain-containing protein [Rhodospirillaceae bacterium]
MAIATRHRVRAHTPPRINAALEEDIRHRLTEYATRLEDIEARLRTLDREWDIERAIEANASSLALAGLALGVLHDRRWLALPIVVAGFLLQHAIQGWCPPVPVLRRMGFRTAEEIGRERVGLKALRGDFEGAAAHHWETPQDRATAALRAAQ